jgi:hypothetical protein
MQLKDEKCGYTKSFSYPVVRGDWAFVEEASHCGELCGSGRLFALRLENSSWRMVADLGLWIS